MGKSLLKYSFLILFSCGAISSSVFARMDSTPSAAESCIESIRKFVQPANIFAQRQLKKMKDVPKVLGVAYRGDPNAINRTIKTVTGVRAYKKLPVAIAEIESWIKQYRSYSDDLENLNKARSRYISDDPAVYRGRIEIFEAAVKNGRFPIELQIPRDSYLEAEEIIASKSGRVLTTEKIDSMAELKKYLDEDLEKLKKINAMILRRKILQAEIYFYLKALLNHFSKESLERAIETYRNDPGKGASLAIKPLKLITEAYELVGSEKSEFEKLKPTQDSLNYVLEVTKKKTWPKVLGQRHLVEITSAKIKKTYEHLIGGQQLHSKVMALVAFFMLATGTYWTAFNRKVIAPIQESTLSETDKKEKDLMELLKTLEKNISIPAFDQDGFDWEYLKFAQTKWDDEAVDIFTDVIKGKRDSIYIDPVKDKDMKPEKHQSFLTQATEALRIREYLIHGYENAYGKIQGVGSRLDRRSKIVKKLKEPNVPLPANVLSDLRTK